MERRKSAFKNFKTKSCIEQIAGVAGLAGHFTVNIVKQQGTVPIQITAKATTKHEQF